MRRASKKKKVVKTFTVACIITKKKREIEKQRGQPRVLARFWPVLRSVLDWDLAYCVLGLYFFSQNSIFGVGGGM